MNHHKARLWLVPLILTFLASACFTRIEDEPDAELPASLTAGSIELDLYPMSSVGISGLGEWCRLVHNCACPILSPDTVEWCRQEAWIYDEETCQSIIYNQVPECIE